MTGRENRTRETRGGESPAQGPVTAPSRRRLAFLTLFSAVALGFAAAPPGSAIAQSRDGQLRFPNAGSMSATSGLPSQPGDGAPVDSGTTVIGGAGSGVSVDFSVLDTLDRARGRELLFPDPNFRGNRERVVLTPPGSGRVTLTPPGEARRGTKPAAGKSATAKSTTRAAPKPQPPSPDIQAARPAAKPSAPERMTPDVPPSTASAPPPPASPQAPSEAEAKAEPAPGPKAEPKPEPKSAPDAQTAKKSEPAPAPAPEPAPAPARETAAAPPEPEIPPPLAFDRKAVPPPPVAAEPEHPAGSGTAAEVPPVDAAPRTGVTQQKMQPPEPPPASKTPEQTAALPPTDTPWTPGRTRAIDFPAGGAKLPDDGQETLKAAARAVAADDRLRVELKAYAAGDANSESQARRLSLSRALSVRSFLIREGVQSTRIDVRALGNRVSSGEPDRVDVTVVSR